MKNEAATSESVRRKYAEFHRKLGELLNHLVDEAETHWAGFYLREHFGDEVVPESAATGHVIGDGGANNYRKAVYLLSHNTVEGALDDLKKVQREALVLAGHKAVTPELLLPQLFLGVQLVKARAQRVFTDADKPASAVADELATHLSQTEANARAFERFAVDDATARLYDEVRALQVGLERLRAHGGRVIVRRRTHRLCPSVYVVGASRPRAVYLRDVGLVCVGGSFMFDAVPRKPRKDRVTPAVLEPLAAFADRLVYDAKDFSETVERLRDEEDSEVVSTGASGSIPHRAY